MNTGLMNSLAKSELSDIQYLRHPFLFLKVMYLALRNLMA